MKVFRAVIATNSVITLANGVREIIADEALENAAEQMNANGGIPSLIEHDWLRPCGWAVHAWTEREGEHLSLVVRSECPETDSEWQDLLNKHRSHLANEFETRARPYKPILRDIGVSDAELAFDVDSVLLEGNDLAERLFPAVFSDEDDDGLVRVDSTLLDADGFLVIDDLFLVPSLLLRPSLGLPNAPNREVIATLMRLAAREGIEVRLRLDRDRLGIRRSYSRTEQRDYWWGPHYEGKPSEQPRGVTVHGPTRDDMLNKLIRTEFWWYGKAEPTFEVEELHDRTVELNGDANMRAMRFVHSIHDVGDVPRHIDGAIRIYSPSLWSERLDSKISGFGKKATRIKLWRVDGRIGVDEWHELVHMFFRGNYTIGEYFGFPSPAEYRAAAESAE